MSTEKFLVYFLLIAIYAVYTRFSDDPEHHRMNPNPAVASIHAPAPNIGPGAPPSPR